jgi:glucosamine--fructose-6-phosphate aminotransferase (isomerizing)
MSSDSLSPGAFFRAEIREQPEAVARLIDLEMRRAQTFARALSRRDIRFVLIAARGSSDNAARFAQYAFGLACRLPVALAAPSLSTIYGRPPRVKDALVIGISQSGRSPDVVEVIAAARKGGAATLALVNDPESPLARAASEVIPLHAGVERSVAATKTYTTELAAAALVALTLGRRHEELAALSEIPSAMTRALELERAAAESARLFVKASRAAVLARGVNFPTANELALKLKETCLLPAEPFSSADFLHGPIAVAGAGFPAVIVSPPGAAAARELALLARKLAARGSAVLSIGPKGSPLPLPRLPEILSPIVAIVPGQLLALALALAKGLDPDRPRGLKKVTETT